jgi:hypothetical protein
MTAPPALLAPADQVFRVFSELYPHRPMVAAIGLALGGEPDRDALQAVVDGWCATHPRLGWRIRDRSTWETSVRPEVREVAGPAADAGALLADPPRLDGAGPPWRMERVAGEGCWGVRLVWHHALCDGEGMLRMLGGRAPAERGPDALPAPVAQGGLAWLLRLLRERSPHPPLRLAQGTAEVAFRLVPTPLAPEAVAEAGGRAALVALSASAVLAVLPEPATVRVLAPSFGTRDPTAPLELGNDRRLFTRTALAPAPLPDLLREAIAQAAAARATPYAALRLLGRLPPGLVDRLLSRAPPVIVNQDAAGLADAIREVAGVEVRGLAFRPPLLPHQGCTFVWWSWRGRMCCSVTADRALIPDVDALVDRLGDAVAGLESLGAVDPR